MYRSSDTSVYSWHNFNCLCANEFSNYEPFNKHKKSVYFWIILYNSTIPNPSPASFVKILEITEFNDVNFSGYSM